MKRSRGDADLLQPNHKGILEKRTFPPPPVIPLRPHSFDIATIGGPWRTKLFFCLSFAALSGCLELHR